MFSWQADKVRCEAASPNTLRIYQTARPPGHESDAGYFDRDTVKYIWNHPDKLRAIKQAGFDRVECVVVNGNGPGRSTTTVESIDTNGKMKLLEFRWDGTDGRTSQ